jgi:hypothetical protein
MDIYDEYVTPPELSGYARAALQDRPENELSLADWFPYQPVNDLVYRFNRGGGGLLEAAEFRAYDAEPGFGAREGISRVTGELPPIGQQYVLDEYNNLRLRNAGEEIRNLLLRDAARIAKQIDIRMEYARAEALVSATVTLNERGVQATVDFARSGTHSVTAAVAWSDHATSTPISDLQAWSDTYAETNGQRPGAILMSLQARGHLLRNAEVQGQVFPLAATAPQVTVTQLNTVLADFDLPPITVYDAKARRAGTVQRYIAADKVLLLPPRGNALGATLYGTTLEAQEPEYGFGGADLPGLVVGAFKQKTTPIRVFTIGSAIALPILGDPDLSFVADVL